MPGQPILLTDVLVYILNLMYELPGDCALRETTYKNLRTSFYCDHDKLMYIYG